MLLEDFNYFLQKAIYQYINKKYNTYDVNQQSTDDLRVLTGSASLLCKNANNGIATFELPTDYVHLLNCMCTFKISKSFSCYDINDEIDYPAKRLTADILPMIMKNYYMKPSYNNPYYYIRNTNVPARGTADSGDYESPNYNGINIPTSAMLPLENINIKGDNSFSFINKQQDQRYGNSEPINIEIRYGNSPNYELEKITVDYIKAPLHVELTNEELYTVQDNSQVLEFPDYVCYEIINELVKLFLENSTDPRLQTNIPVNQTIASPIQQGH